MSWDDAAEIVEPIVTGIAESRDQHRGADSAIDPDDYGRSGQKGERAEVGKPYVHPARLAILVGLLAGLALWQGLPIMVVVLAVIVMIFFHELGHYVMARRAGMKVTEFMIGFGPRIFSFRRGDVEYGLKAIPAGAYVKIIGMANVEEVPPEDEEFTYRQKGYWARMGVAVAGSTMHFIMALVLISLSFVFVGRIEPENWAVDNVVPGSAADLAGVKEGDRVTAVGSVDVTTFDGMATQAKKHPGETIPVEVLRDGRTVALTAPITARFAVYGTNRAEFQLFGGTDGRPTVSVDPANPVGKAGLTDGDVIVSVDGTAVETVRDAHEALSADAVQDRGAVELSVEREGLAEATVVEVDAGTRLGVDPLTGFLGVGPTGEPEKLSPLAAVPAAFDWFGEVTVQSVSGMVKFFSPSSLASFAERAFTTAPGTNHDEGVAQSSSGRRDAAMERDGNRIVSIVGAVALGEDLTSDGWLTLLSFLAFLNMAIGIFNLVPLPPFDGGHVAIGTYEKIRELLRRDGRRYLADFNKLMPVAYVVVTFMLVVGLMAIYLDLADPIRV